MNADISIRYPDPHSYLTGAREALNKTVSGEPFGIAWTNGQLVQTNLGGIDGTLLFLRFYLRSSAFIGGLLGLKNISL